MLQLLNSSSPFPFLLFKWSLLAFVRRELPGGIRRRPFGFPRLMSFFAHRHWTSVEKGSMLGAQNCACRLRIGVGAQIICFYLRGRRLFGAVPGTPPVQILMQTILLVDPETDFLEWA